jgi:HK97 family phage major capsid protein
MALDEATRKDIIAVVKESLGAAAAEKAEAEQKKAIEEQQKRAKTGERSPGDEHENVNAFMARAFGQERQATAKNGTELHYREAPAHLRKTDPYLLPGVARNGNDTETFTHGMAARLVRYLMWAKIENGHARFAKDMAKECGHLVTAKALDSTSFIDGGALIDPAFSTEVIEALRAVAVFRGAGPRVIPLNGTMNQPFINIGSAASYVGENQTISKTQPTFGQHQMIERKLAAVLPISNEMIRIGGSMAEAAIMSDLIRAFAVREDLAFLRGDGASTTPRGLKSWTKTTTTANATVNFTNVTADAVSLPAAIEGQNVQITRGYWFMSARSYWYLRALRVTNGEYAFPELQEGSFLGFPFARSTQIPNNIGGSSTGSEIYFVNMDDMQIGQGGSVNIESFPGGTYHDGSALVSGISNDQTVLRGTETHDLMARNRGYEIAMLTDARWF